ncbi:hypothetical protein OAA80_00920 [Amylibacter sp.]|jgi:hypothetical protein|nr:hypothetical protein [Amylibacter sp.]
MSINFDQVITKLKKAEFAKSPFKHIYLNNVFSENDFKKITECPEIKLRSVSNDEELFEQLFENGYKIIKFPGCIADKEYYIDWHNSNDRSKKKIINNEACEGFGMTVRLISPKSQILADLKGFIESELFLSVLAEKFDIDLSECEADNGIQKYLDGYEISPHPDIRRKALTYMVNINSTPNSSILDHHTRYLRLKENYSYLSEFWKNNEDVERAWVPWEWCDIDFQQTINNSMVIFSPSHDTLHAVKADYDHLSGQRTQLYGNLWYKKVAYCRPSEWVELDLVKGVGDATSVLKKRDEDFRRLQRGSQDAGTTLSIKHRT